jgi:hypothetical protein
VPSKDHSNAKYCCNEHCSLVASTVIFGRSEVEIVAQKLTILEMFHGFSEFLEADGGRISSVRLSISCHAFSNSLFTDHPTGQHHIAWCH